MGLEELKHLSEARALERLREIEGSIAPDNIDDVLDWVSEVPKFHKDLFKDVACTLSRTFEQTTEIKHLKRILEFFKSNLARCEAEVAEHFIYVSLMVHGVQDECLDSIAGEILDKVRQSAGQSDSTFQVLVSVLRTRVVTKLKTMAELKCYVKALAIWRAIVRATKLKITTAVTNDVLMIATMAFKESNPDYHALAFESWRILIENLPSELIRKPAYIRLVLNPLNRTYRDTDVNSTLKKYVAWWHHVIRLGANIEDNFDEIAVPLLQKIFCMPSAKARQVNPTAFANPTRVVPACSYVVFALLWYDGNEQHRQDVSRFVDSDFELNSHRVSASCLAKQLSVLEEALTLIVNNISQKVSVPADGYAFVLCRILIGRIRSFYEHNHHDMVRLILSTVYGILRAKVLAVDETLLLFRELCQGLPQKVMSSSQFNFRKGTFSMHECPVLTLTTFYVRHVADACDASVGEDHRKSYRQGLRLLLEQANAGTINVLRFVGHLIASLQDCSSYQAESWTDVSATLTDHVKISHDINQGGNLEHDFSTVLSTLVFPFRHTFPQTNESFKKWTELLNVFIIEANLVKDIAPNQPLAEVCDRIHALLSQSNYRLYQLQLMSQKVECMAKHIFLGQVAPSDRKKSPLGHLEPFVKLLALLIEFGTKCIPEKKQPKTSAQFFTIVLGIVVTLVRDAACPDLCRNLILRLIPTVLPLISLSRSRSALRNTVLAFIESPLATLIRNVIELVNDKAEIIPNDGPFPALIQNVVQEAALHWKSNVRESNRKLAATFSVAIGEPENSQSFSESISIQDATLPMASKLSKSLSPTCQLETDVHTTNRLSNLLPDHDPAPDLAARTLLDQPKKTSIKRSWKSEAAADDDHDPNRDPNRDHDHAHNHDRNHVNVNVNVNDDDDDVFTPIRSSSKKQKIYTEHQLEKLKEQKMIPSLYEDLSQSTQDDPVRNSSSSMESKTPFPVVLVPNRGSSSSGSDESIPKRGRPSNKATSRKSLLVNCKQGFKGLGENSSSDDNIEPAFSETSRATSPEIATTKKNLTSEDQNRENKEPKKSGRGRKKTKSLRQTVTPEPIAQPEAAGETETVQHAQSSENQTDEPSVKPKGARKRKLGKSLQSPVTMKLEAKKLHVRSHSGRSRRSSSKFLIVDTPHEPAETAEVAVTDSLGDFEESERLKCCDDSRNSAENNTLTTDEAVGDSSLKKHTHSCPSEGKPFQDLVASADENETLSQDPDSEQSSLVTLIKASKGSERDHLLRFVSSPEFLHSMDSEERKKFLTAFLTNITNFIH